MGKKIKPKSSHELTEELVGLLEKHSIDHELEEIGEDEEELEIITLQDPNIQLFISESNRKGSYYLEIRDLDGYEGMESRKYALSMIEKSISEITAFCALCGIFDWALENKILAVDYDIDDFKGFEGRRLWARPK
jgi:hypothetical protein